jgi:5'-3' exonuclease
MQHIRELRASRSYPANSTHCIYGQDADLIMLGLVTHEPHFCILREVIDFNFNFASQKTLKAVKKFTKESDFQLLHLSVLREYLALEFCREGDYDLERVIDDFVFMTFLVGNDFLPHMPTLDIGDGAFDLLFSIYREQRTSWNGEYLTNSGEVSDPQRLETFLAAIGAVESEILEQKEKDEAAYIKKKRRWDKRDGKPEGPSDAQLKNEEATRQNEYLSMMEAVLAAPRKPSDFVSGWSPVAEAGQKDFKGRYYFEKLHFTPVDKDKHWELRRSYMEGLMWCLAYYYKGCISWGTSRIVLAHT